MKQSQAKRPTSRLAGVAIAAALSMAFATPALAEVQSLTGVDYLYPTEKSYVVPEEGASGFVDILAVSSNEPNDMVYLKLTEPNGKIIADHLGFMLGDAAKPEDAEYAELVKDEDGNPLSSDTDDYTAMISINIDQLNFASPSTTYNIQVFDNRKEDGDPIYDGTIELIYAILEGEANPRQIGRAHV